MAHPSSLPPFRPLAVDRTAPRVIAQWGAAEPDARRLRLHVRRSTVSSSPGAPSSPHVILMSTGSTCPGPGMLCSASGGTPPWMSMDRCSRGRGGDGAIPTAGAVIGDCWRWPLPRCRATVGAPSPEIQWPGGGARRRSRPRALPFLTRSRLGPRSRPVGLGIVNSGRLPLSGRRAADSVAHTSLSACSRLCWDRSVSGSSASGPPPLAYAAFILGRCSPTAPRSPGARHALMSV